MHIHVYKYVIEKYGDSAVLHKNILLNELYHI